MVKIYSRPGCSPCATLKYWLNKKNVPYEELSAEGTDVYIFPTVEVDGQRIIGLDIRRLSELLGV